jgi:hypothetical protein
VLGGTVAAVFEELDRCVAFESRIVGKKHCAGATLAEGTSIRYLPNKLPEESIGENCSAGADGGGDFPNRNYRAIAGSIRRTAPSSASVNR